MEHVPIFTIAKKQSEIANHFPFRIANKFQFDIEKF